MCHNRTMATRSGEKRDFMQVAREVVERTIGEHMDGTPLEKPLDEGSPHAVALRHDWRQEGSGCEG